MAALAAVHEVQDNPCLVSLCIVQDQLEGSWGVAVVVVGVEEESVSGVVQADAFSPLWLGFSPPAGASDL